MSLEEEVELRDLVAQTLEGNGVLPKIRAQLRANLFLALDEDSKISKQQPLLNKKIKSQLAGPEGQLMFCLVREFLEYFNLDCTISVYEPESYIGSCYKYEGREKIIEELALNEENLTGPILLHLIKIAQAKSKTLKINLTNLNGENVQNGSSSLSSVPEVNGSGFEGDSGSPKQSVGEGQLLNVLQHLNPSNKVDKKTDLPLDSTYTKKEVENDDTFNGTSSIEEESVNGTDVLNPKFSINEEEGVSSTEQDGSPESRSKLSKSDKIKSKLELSPLNKSRGSDILPSLYTKDFKDKNKDFDFDIKDDYEEDFMSGSEVEFSLSKVDCPKPLLEELQQYSSEKTSSKKNKNSMKNSKSDNKLLNSCTTTSDDIETNLSVEGETDVSSRTQIKS